MSFVTAAPEALIAAATDLQRIGAELTAAGVAAAHPTASVLAAGADEISAAIATLFSGHAQSYQSLSARATAFHAQFIQALTSGAGAYSGAEATNALAQSVEADILGVINAPTNALLGRPLIGDGAPGAPGQNGGAGGLLFGNGGRGGNGLPGQVGGNGGSAGMIGTGG
ncbi:PE family protein, partial [Mycobacterium intermedium]